MQKRKKSLKCERKFGFLIENLYFCWRKSKNKNHNEIYITNNLDVANDIIRKSE